LWTRHPATITRLHWPASFMATASRISWSDSRLEASRNPHVLITIASARLESGVTTSPSSASSPSIRSLSTRFLGQPRLTKATVLMDDPDLRGMGGGLYLFGHQM